MDVLGMRPWRGIWYEETEREGRGIMRGLVARVEVSRLSLRCGRFFVVRVLKEELRVEDNVYSSPCY